MYSPPMFPLKNKILLVILQILGGDNAIRLYVWYKYDPAGSFISIFTIIYSLSLEVNFV